MTHTTHAGIRCRTIRRLRTVDGDLPSGSQGTVRNEVDNLGRRLVVAHGDRGLIVPASPMNKEKMSGHRKKTKGFNRLGTYFILLLTMLWWGTPSHAQEEDVIAAGKKEFRRSCILCHGLSGAGESVMTTMNLLTIKPPDLRRLSERHAGKFPFWYVYRVIDGREVIRGHGTRDMPIWGDVFIRQEDGTIEKDSRAIGRILSLIYYLQSVQEPSGKK